MCMFDGDHDWQLAKVRTWRSKKERRCGECGRGIAVGDTYESFNGLSDSGWFYACTCVHCVAARDWLAEECDGWLFEGVMEDLEAHFDEQPDLALGRLVVSMRRGWRRRDGTLMPVPPPEATTSAPWHAKAARAVRV